MIKKIIILLFPGIILSILLFFGGSKIMTHTSTNDYCMSCHIHPQADMAWKQSTHYQTESGMRIGCVDCHLPPKGEGYFWEKSKAGIRDVWGKWTKDPKSFNWEEKGRLENARHHVFKSSCVKCHENLFPSKLSKDGENAHLYYNQNKENEELHCINCHLNAGHYIEGYTHGSNSTFGTASSAASEIFTESTKVEEFKDYIEKIPSSSAAFKMVAIQGGKFKMGSPGEEPYRKDDEGPVRDVEISSFFMAEIEVSWEEYLTYYAQTSGERKSTDTKDIQQKNNNNVDAISGATPPYGQPDKGWGKGKRPAMSFSFHAAETYCKWLSSVTGKTYRLPTEAEWEYACRAKTETPYFFAGDPKKFEKRGFWAKFSDNDTTTINSYATYKENSQSKTQLPDKIAANAFGLKNMTGNVAEFCSDWYQPDTYSKYPSGVIKDPKGPETGTERVVRGGSYLSTADMLRSAARDYTRTEAWLKTDPQIPKSIWWYSDCFYVGLRVVCEYNEKTGKK